MKKKTNRPSFFHEKKKAERLINRKCFSEARDIYKHICKNNKTDQEAWLMLSTLHGWMEDFEASELCLQQTISISPRDTMAHYNLGLAQQKQGKLEAAKISLARCLELHPASIEAQYHLAITLQLNGELKDAESLIRQSIKHNPGISELHAALAGIRYSAGDYPASINSCKDAIRLKPGSAESYYLLGRCFAASDMRDDALKALDQAIKVDPLYMDAYSFMSVISSDESKMQVAAGILENSLRQAPNDTGSLLKLGNLYFTMHEREKSSHCYRRLVALRPAHPEAHYNLGLIHESLHELDKALQEFRKAGHSKHEYEEAITGQARVLVAKGRHEDAHTLITEFISGRRKPCSAWLTVIHSDILCHAQRENDAIQLLESFLDSAIRDTPDLNVVHFRLGKINDKHGSYNKAFAHFKQANNISRCHFDYKKQVDFLDNVKRAFSREVLSNLKTSTTTSELPVFIVGMPRSGTSLVEQILDSHPLIHGAGELPHIGDIFRNILETISNKHGASFPDSIKHLDANMLTTYAESYLSKLEGFPEGVLRVTDKMPQNFIELGLIELLFQNVRVIHCRRDPIDTCLSIYFNNFEDLHAYSFKLKSIGEYYRKYTQLMEHWKESLSIPIYEVHYEDMINSQETVSRELVEFCGLKWDSSCLSFHTNDRILNTFSREQIQKPIYTTSVNRWHHYAPHIEGLIDSLHDTLS